MSYRKNTSQIKKEKPVLVKSLTPKKDLNDINDIKYINERIEKEICSETINKLTDEKLLDKYNECPSVIRLKTKLDDILSKYLDDILSKDLDDKDIKYEKLKESKPELISKLIPELIPAGTKGVIRGNTFNEIVKRKIESFKLNENENFDVCFEKNCEKYMTDEIPDWYISEKSTGKTIIGMNQLALWGGGQQLNRGSKYLINNQNNSENSKLLCVVANKKEFKNNINKAFNLFKVGFENNTLCYLNNLQNIIYSYFNLE